MIAIEIAEQNQENVTWGFGVVFSDTPLDFLKEDDPETHAAIVPHMEQWRDLTLDIRGERIAIDGVGFAAIGRLHLLQLLTARARSVGLPPRFGVRREDLSDLDGFDLVIGADRLHSVVRAAGDFGTSLHPMKNHFIWYGTERPFGTLTQSFRDSRFGRFNAHHYRYAPNMSTFIVETDHPTWAAAGFERMIEPGTRAICEEIFADVLQGAPLVSNNSYWRTFPVLWNERWYDGNKVLLGDAVHTAHFSIGSGTRLAMEDAIALVRALEDAGGDIASGLAGYQAARKPIVQKIVTAANQSALWYENFAQHMDLPAWEFANSYIRRGGRIDDDRLRAPAPTFMTGLEASRSTALLREVTGEGGQDGRHPDPGGMARLLRRDPVVEHDAVVEGAARPGAEGAGHAGRGGALALRRRPALPDAERRSDHRQGSGAPGADPGEPRLSWRKLGDGYALCRAATDPAGRDRPVSPPHPVGSALRGGGRRRLHGGRRRAGGHAGVRSDPDAQLAAARPRQRKRRADGLARRARHPDSALLRFRFL